MPLDDNEAWLHPIKAISVKRDKPGVPRPEGAYDSGHEPSDEDELHDYQARYGSLGDPQGVLSLTERFDAFWDETQEHRVLIT